MKLKSLARETAAGILLVAIGLLLCVLLYGIGLTMFDIPAACAEETRCPVALVNVNPGSRLNVRESPNGRVVGRLSRGADVVVLDRQDGWSLVTTERDMAHGHRPLGWVYADYLEEYRFIFQPKEQKANGL